MAAPSVTYTFTNITTADATQVNQNFTDIINGVTDGTKDLSINALTCAGNATLNGNTTIGNATSDTLTVTAGVAADFIPATDAARSLGSATLAWLALYLSGNSFQHKIQGNAAAAADVVITLPPVTSTIATLAGTETLSNKTLTAPVIGAATGTSLALSGNMSALGGSYTAGMDEQVTASGSDTVANIDMYAIRTGAGAITVRTTLRSNTAATYVVGGGGVVGTITSHAFGFVVNNGLVASFGTGGTLTLSYALVQAVLALNTNTTQTSLSVVGVNIITLGSACTALTINSFTGGVAGQMLQIVSISSAVGCTLAHGGTGTQTLLNNAGVALVISGYGGASYYCDGSSWWNCSSAL